MARRAAVVWQRPGPDAPFIPGQTLETFVSLRDQGYDLTNDEIVAAVQTGVRLWRRGSKGIDARLQCCRLTPGSPSDGDDSGDGNR